MKNPNGSFNLIKPEIIKRIPTKILEIETSIFIYDSFKCISANMA